MQLVRVLVYRGSAEWVKDCLDRRGIKESRVVGMRDGEECKIIEAHIGFDGGFFETFYNNEDEKEKGEQNNE